MGTITARKRANGALSYTAQIRIKRGGKIVYSEAETFNRKQNASLWIRNRESELDVPGALDKAIANKGRDATVTLDDAIDRYIKEMTRKVGRTKSQVLASIRSDDIAGLRCSQITSDQIVAYARRLLEGGRQPSTVGNYLSHLSSVMAIGRAAWKYELDPEQMIDAQRVLRKLGTIGKSTKRERRPTLAELDRLMTYFTEQRARAPEAIPMHIVIPFAIFSTRRQDEITRIEWHDYDRAHARVLVRDMKHPGQKIGNDIWCDLPDPAPAIIALMAEKTERIFPYNPRTISSIFTDACQFLKIDNLHFHDLRHDGMSRLFEMGRTIPLVASVSGHRSWSSMQRYTHIKEIGDKYAGWPWLEKIGVKPQ